VNAAWNRPARSYVLAASSHMGGRDGTGSLAAAGRAAMPCQVLGKTSVTGIERNLIERMNLQPNSCDKQPEKGSVS